jgi:hypothetical protein
MMSRRLVYDPRAAPPPPLWPFGISISGGAHRRRMPKTRFAGRQCWNSKSPPPRLAVASGDRSLCRCRCGDSTTAVTMDPGAIARTIEMDESD